MVTKDDWEIVVQCVKDECKCVAFELIHELARHLPAHDFMNATRIFIHNIGKELMQRSLLLSTW
jgi:hypothetical protein